MQKVNYNPRISIIMVNYNGLQYLQKSIQPILDLDYPNYEFIIVDNGSTDGSIEYIKTYKNVHLEISPKRQSKNFACNFAANLSNGEYLLFLDCDCVITNFHILEELIDQHLNNQNIGLIGLSYFDYNENKTNGYGNFYQNFLVENKPFLPFEKVMSLHNSIISFPSGIGIFISRIRWQELGGYDDTLIFGGDDSDLGIRLWLFGYRNYLYSRTIQMHIGKQEKQNNKKYAAKYSHIVCSRIYDIIKNYQLANLIIAIPYILIIYFLKTIKQSIIRSYPLLFVSYIYGLYLTIIKIPTALAKRKIIQKNRKINFDIFLKIKSPI